MILLIRLSIILLLTLLQFAAPLIHAHTFHSNYFESSIHLPEFEQVDSLRQKSPTIQNAIIESNNMVVISAGIKNERHNLQFLTENSMLGLLFLILIVTSRRTVIRCFFSQTEPISSKLLLTIFAPRAPPAIV